MNINIDYIKGVTEATLDFYETINGRIDRDKSLEIFYETILDSKTKTIIVGIKINFVWITELTRGVTDNVRDDNSICIYSKDKIDAVISDISSILNDIDQSQIIK